MDEIAKRAFAEAKCMLHGKRGQPLRTEIEHAQIAKYIEIEMERTTALWRLCLQCCPKAKKPRLATFKADAAKRFKVDSRTIDTAWTLSRASINKRADKASKLEPMIFTTGAAVHSKVPLRVWSEDAYRQAKAIKAK
jgi:hypothetical protein